MTEILGKLVAGYMSVMIPVGLMIWPVAVIGYMAWREHKNDR